MNESRLKSIRRLVPALVLAIAGLTFMASNGLLVAPGIALFPLAAIFALAVSDWLRGLLHSFSMAFLPTEIPFVLGFFLASPSELVAGITLASGLLLLTNGRRAPLRALVNGMMGIGFSSFAASLFHIFGLTSIRDPRAWIAALTLTVAVELASEALVASDVRIRSGQWQSDLRDALKTGSPLTAVNTSLALIGLVLLDVHPAAPLLLLPALVILARAYRAHMGRSDDVRRLALLNLVSTLSPTLAEPVDRPHLMSLVASVTNADVVDLVIHGLVPPRTIWELGQLETMESVGSEPPVAEVYALAPPELALLGGPGARLAWRSGLGVRLDDGSSAIGWIAIGRGTDTNPSSFDELDHRMFGLLAGVVSGFVARGMLITAVAERDEQATHLRYRAMHDGLTKVLAAHEFRAELGRAAASLDPGHKVLIYIDLDGFKPINDRYGHAAGDSVLVEVAVRLRQSVRTHDRVGRMGGDEFAILATLDGSSRVDEIAERLLAAIQEPIEFFGNPLRVSASIGIAPLGTGEAAELLMRADAAMYEAKAAGGGGWRQAEPRKVSHAVLEPGT